MSEPSCPRPIRRVPPLTSTYTRILRGKLGKLDTGRYFIDSLCLPTLTYNFWDSMESKFCNCASDSVDLLCPIFLAEPMPCNGQYIRSHFLGFTNGVHRLFRRDQASLQRVAPRVPVAHIPGELSIPIIFCEAFAPRLIFTCRLGSPDRKYFGINPITVTGCSPFLSTCS
jgi:hypothetical protein